MGMKISSSSVESQERRLKIKSLGQQMKQAAIMGAGLSPWEAELLVDIFSHSSTRSAQAAG